MRASALFFSLLSVLVVSIVGCGGDQTPKETLDSAIKAHFTDKDYDSAITLYRQVLDWKAEGSTPTDNERFTAALNIIRCKVQKKDYDGALDSLKEMQGAFKDKVTTKNYGTVIGDLMTQKETGKAIDAIELAIKAFPDKKEEFRDKVELIKKMDLSSEEMERLASLGYL